MKKENYYSIERVKSIEISASIKKISQIELRVLDHEPTIKGN